MKKKKNKHYWLLIYVIAAVLCYVSYYFTRNYMWFIFGILFVFCGGLNSMEVKKEDKLKEGGYNQRNLDKAKKYEKKKI